MPNSAHFERRAAYYRLLAAAAENEQIAERQLSLANLFLLLSGGLRKRNAGRLKAMRQSFPALSRRHALEGMGEDRRAGEAPAGADDSADRSSSREGLPLSPVGAPGACVSERLLRLPGTFKRAVHTPIFSPRRVGARDRTNCHGAAAPGAAFNSTGVAFRLLSCSWPSIDPPART
jgi:hypothetical protein